MSPWKRKLAPIWLSQFLSLMGFSFSLPFIPYYLQDLGVTEPARLKLWIALFGSATPMALVVFSPIWGSLADRYGRRVMLLRANFAAAIVLALMGLARGPLDLVILRLLQGCFTGTVTAAQAMVAVQAPRHRSGAALGTLSAAVFSGTMMGGALGGLVADLFGYRVALAASGWLLLGAGALIVFGTTETVVRDEDAAPEAAGSWLGARHLGAAVPLLVLMGGIAFCRQFDLSFLPLLVQDIHGSLRGAARWSGIIAAVGGAAGFLAGVTLGNLADRVRPYTLVRLYAMGGALLMIPQGLAHSFGVLLPTRLFMVYCAGGLDPAVQVWLTRVTPESRRGSVFGWAGTARSLGWFLAPVASGLVASTFGVRWVYFYGSACFVLLAVLAAAVRRRVNAGAAPADGASGDA